MWSERTQPYVVFAGAFTGTSIADVARTPYPELCTHLCGHPGLGLPHTPLRALQQQVCPPLVLAPPRALLRAHLLPILPDGASRALLRAAGPRPPVRTLPRTSSDNVRPILSGAPSWALLPTMRRPLLPTHFTRGFAGTRGELSTRIPMRTPPPSGMFSIRAYKATTTVPYNQCADHPPTHFTCMCTKLTDSLHTECSVV